MNETNAYEIVTALKAWGCEAVPDGLGNLWLYGMRPPSWFEEIIASRKREILDYPAIIDQINGMERGQEK